METWNAHDSVKPKSSSVYCDRLGGVIAAYKVVPDEMDEIKVST